MEAHDGHVRHKNHRVVFVVFSFQLAAKTGYPVPTPDSSDSTSEADSMTKMLRLCLFTLLAIAWFLALPYAAVAQDQDQQVPSDPPTRVARLNYIQGSVSFQPAGENDWIEANPNRPLTTGDNLWADKNSRGEVHIGATGIRLSSETGISFLNLDDRTVQLQLAQGIIEVHLRHLEPGNAFEIDTPNLAFTLTASGEYRVQTDPDGNSTVIVVREGEGQVTGGGETYDLPAGQQYFFTGTDQLTYDAQAAPEFDDFENWCQSRDQFENSSRSAKYVSRDVDGYYDLDQYGQWQTDPDYGAIWVPSAVLVGWAPYHYGHWVWVGPWGWTWVDDAPWGFAPFHYGRWAYVRGYWGWVPGPMVVRPVYAPAVVGFVGGGGFSVAVGFGGGFAGVAWFPLGPRDVYVPGYRCSPRYFQSVNVTNTRVVNVTQVTNVYNTVVINRNVTVNRVNYTYANNAAAVTAVSRETFVGARPVAAAAVRVSPEQLQSARVTEAKPLAPTRASYVAATAKVAYAKPAVPFSQRQVVARLNPPAPVVSHGATRVVNADASPRGAEPATRGGVPPARTNRAAEPAVRTNNQPARENPSAPRPNVYTNENIPHTPPPSAAEKAQEDRAFQQQKSEEKSQEAAPTEQRPPVKFAPPARAKEENYDVHPPLNRKTEAPQQQQERRSEPPAKAPAHEAPPPKESRPKS
jgi:hypothetical protein